MGGTGEGDVQRGGPDHIDIAALLGAGLAATISLVVGSGPWTPISVPIGLVLVAVVLAPVSTAATHGVVHDAPLGPGSSHCALR
jgi:hypothetical protein